ncbi:MAG: hypothetical protein MHM6MM_000156 [Cercozoa sp. M6MM]
MLSRAQTAAAERENELATRLSDLEAELQKTNGELEDRQSQLLHEHRTRVEQHSIVLETCQQRCLQFSGVVEQHERRMWRRIELLAKLTTGLETRVQEAKQILRRQNTARRESKHQIAEAERKNSLCREALQSEKRRVSELKQQLQKLRQQASLRDTEALNLQATLREKEQEMSHITKQLKHFQEAAADADELRKSRRSLELEATRVQDENFTLKATIRQLQSRLESAQTTHVDALRSRVRQLEDNARVQHAMSFVPQPQLHTAQQSQSNAAESAVLELTQKAMTEMRDIVSHVSNSSSQQMLELRSLLVDTLTAMNQVAHTRPDQSKAEAKQRSLLYCVSTQTLRVAKRSRAVQAAETRGEAKVFANAATVTENDKDKAAAERRDFSLQATAESAEVASQTVNTAESCCLPDSTSESGKVSSNDSTSEHTTGMQQADERVATGMLETREIESIVKHLLSDVIGEPNTNVNARPTSRRRSHDHQKLTRLERFASSDIAERLLASPAPSAASQVLFE